MCKSNKAGQRRVRDVVAVIAEMDRLGNAMRAQATRSQRQAIAVFQRQPTRQSRHAASSGDAL